MRALAGLALHTLMLLPHAWELGVSPYPTGGLRPMEPCVLVAVLLASHQGAVAVDAGVRASAAPALVAIRSFTPINVGQVRTIEVGVLFDRDDELALGVASALDARGLKVALNGPCSGKAGLLDSVDRHAHHAVSRDALPVSACGEFSRDERGPHRRELGDEHGRKSSQTSDSARWPWARRASFRSGAVRHPSGGARRTCYTLPSEHNSLLKSAI